MDILAELAASIGNDPAQVAGQARQIAAEARATNDLRQLSRVLAVLGRALQDRDRCVRVIAENGLRDLWLRDGSEEQQSRIRTIVRLNASGQFNSALDAADDLIDDAPNFAEAWNQRAIAYFQMDRYEESASDCQQTLEINPYHFGAAVGTYLPRHCDGLPAVSRRKST